MRNNKLTTSEATIITISTMILFAIFAWAYVADMADATVRERYQHSEYADPSRQDTFEPCDTDEDCYEKNGCGGYADPCEQDYYIPAKLGVTSA